jgi:hydrogenase small subunit
MFFAKIDFIMSSKRPTYYQELRHKGYSRRDFMKFCAFISAFLGLDSTAIGQIANALESKPRIPVIWLHFQECTGCTESFIRSSHPIVADLLFDEISLDYTETLQAAAGNQAEACKNDIIEKYHGEYILCVEGSVPMKDNGVYCCIGGRSAKDILIEAADCAKAIIAWGSCACHGSVQAARPNPTGAMPVHKLINNIPIVKVPGCPPIGEVMAGVLVHILTFGRLPELDNQGRPKAFYSRRVHDTCYRRPNYDAGLFVESFDDENAKKGYCLYKVGCKGPMTYNACGVTRWNNGVSFPIQSGHGCLGCSEENFWDNGPFYRRLSSVPGFGIESTADKVGAVAAAVTAIGLGAHALGTRIKKGKAVDDLIDEGKETEQEIEES